MWFGKARIFRQIVCRADHMEARMASGQLASRRLHNSLWSIARTAAGATCAWPGRSQPHPGLTQPETHSAMPSRGREFRGTYPSLCSLWASGGHRDHQTTGLGTQQVLSTHV